MNLIPGAISRKVARTGLVAASNSPKVLFGVGIASVVGSTVLACRATLKLEDILAEGQMNLQAARGTRDIHPEQYSEEDKQKDVGLIYIQTAVKIGRAYAPAIIVGGLGEIGRAHV